MSEEVVIVEPVVVRRKTAARMLDCSESMVLKLQHAGKLRAIKIGSDDRITVESIKAFARPAA